MSPANLWIDLLVTVETNTLCVRRSSWRII